MYRHHVAEPFSAGGDLIFADTVKTFVAFYGYTKVYYSINESPSFVAIARQMNPVHTIIYYYFKVHFNIILPSTA